MSLNDDAMLGEFTVRCHCGKVSAQIQCNRKTLTVWDCSCSDCSMRRNTHFVIPSNQFEVDEAAWVEATTLCLWGTKTAVRCFCKTCGILPWCTPRSNPDGVAVTLPCVDFGADPPQIETKTFDGKNWEDSFKTSTVKHESNPSKTEEQDSSNSVPSQHENAAFLLHNTCTADFFG